MAILTELTAKKRQRNADIIKEYKRMMSNGSQKTAVYDELAANFGVSVSTIRYTVRK